MNKQNIGIGLIGLGAVGGEVARVLMKKADMLAEQVGCSLSLQRIKVLPPDLLRPQAKEMAPELFTTDAEEFFSDPEIDIVVEVIGGEDPAMAYIQRALSSGKHVVTANKEVVAKHGSELFALARQHQVGLHFEASAGGGIPLISPFQHDLVANRIEGIYAIINGTTNYILTRMEREGMDFSLALKTAQELGFAEANPENDING
ncbi:MAG: homoserine dehydrogenase, partial [Chloroflexi bacterium]|nr:homoserine dehydrogenase [Chloroflexota bacterium]